MKIIIFGAGGFIGTNIALKLAKESEYEITMVGKDKTHFNAVCWDNYSNINIEVAAFDDTTDYEKLIKSHDIVIHLATSLMPSNSNINICKEMSTDISPTARLLDACVAEKIKKVIFVSSGGTVYGKEIRCPISETHDTNPINTYGLQKLVIEKMLGLYKQIYGLNYTVLRLANPYGPYQRPNGKLGAVATFTYNAIHDKEIKVYGDGSIIRDYVFIEDVVDCVEKLINSESRFSVYNIGSGTGTSLNELLDIIGGVLGKKLNVCYEKPRSVDVPMNFLDVSRYEQEFGVISKTAFDCGIMRTCEYLNKLQ